MRGRWGYHSSPIRYFSDEEDQRLRELTAEGLSASLVGERLGRTRNSIIGRLHRLGVKRDIPVSQSKPATSRKGIKIKRAKKVEILPPEPPPLVPVCDPVNILGLKGGAISQCRYIIQDQPEKLYCGAESKAGTSWCNYHAAMVFNPAAVRR